MKKNLELILLSVLISLKTFAGLIYVPSDFDVKTAKMVVVIHGCLQTAESMALGSGWNNKADENNLLIYYPQAKKGSNKNDCWNWFDVENQKRESGQLKQIVDEINKIKKDYHLQNNPVFVTGISSGGATTSGLLSCFPEYFQAGAIHSGPAYGLAKNEAEAYQLMSKAEVESNVLPSCQAKKFKGDLMVVQGDQDKVVNPKNAQKIISEFLGDVIPDEKDVEETSALDSSVKYVYKISSYPNQDNRNIKVYLVKGMGHVWSGSLINLRNAAILSSKSQIPTAVPFFKEDGISSTNITWEFFKNSKNREPNSESTSNKLKLNKKKEIKK
ncbi:MAG: PHB depolymerase family esterase [Bdellovibrionaceae bacterium]|nr:PHB depolymerase family esterase [Pseudobdellovibrionaceae bacterium]NUM58805.1 PHB depolymerase family esterase [Pseudobdellovibrionaceae bacterium]